MVGVASMKAVILFAHGSRDPQWHKPIQAVAQRMANTTPEVLVRCAYLELTEPNLLTVVDELAKAGVNHVRVLPMFLGVGKHAREDLPLLMAQLREQHPNMLLDAQPAVGEQPELLDLLAQLALRGL
jgi:sirohydrochlorin cobaltochelatase